MTVNNWKLVDAFFDKYDLVDHHIKSYNDFVNNRIQNIIDITDPISLDDGKYTLTRAYPRECSSLPTSSLC